jgi:hypothetical protein
MGLGGGGEVWGVEWVGEKKGVEKEEWNRGGGKQQ